MKKSFNFLWILVMLNLLIIQQAWAQESMHINLIDGTVVEIPVDDIQKLTFNLTRDDFTQQLLTIMSAKYLADGAENMHINLNDGTVIEIPVEDIQKLIFDLHVGIHPTSELINQLLKLKAYPNPAKMYVNIDYSLSSNGVVTLDIFTMNGHHLENIKQGQQQAGEYQYRWVTNNVPAGTYFFRIHQNDEKVTKKIIIKK